MSFAQIIHIITHLDVFINQLINNYGNLSYILLVLIIFCETGLVITPFLPGDSLLFAIGTITATSSLNLYLIIILLILAAFTGDQCNYWIGRKFGNFILDKKWIKTKYISQTEMFYKNHGKKTLFIARFVPIIRTFAPFVAGVGSMKYPVYILISILSAISWVSSLILLGHYFGNISYVKQNFSLVIMAIIIISILPGIIIAIKNK